MKRYVLTYTRASVDELRAKFMAEDHDAVFALHGGLRTDERARQAALFREFEGDAVAIATYDAVGFGGFDLGVVDSITLLDSRALLPAVVAQAINRVTLRKPDLNAIEWPPGEYDRIAGFAAGLDGLRHLLRRSH